VLARQPQDRAAGHETTATTIAWAVERLQRHPQLLDRLVADLDAGSEELLTATVFEILRTRPVIDTTFRQVKVPTLQIGPWTVPQGHTIAASIGLLHADESVFHDARRFDPDRFISRRPDPAEWIPYGGGVRRCMALSRPWRYASPCELCCATMSSALPTLATKAGNRAGWR
jgi:cytochrome P450 family 138